ncbi:MAG: isochorismatase family protein [Planctomycetota bacterium]
MTASPTPPAQAVAAHPTGALPHATERLNRHGSALVVVDLQERIMPVIDGGAEVIERTRRLIVAARRLEIPVFLTEQVPEKLGATVTPVRDAYGPAPARVKAAFSGCESRTPDDTAGDTLLTALQRSGRRQWILAGVETHVCVLQTALDLLAAGGAVFIVDDATASRDPRHRANALHRIERAGGVIVNHESVLFEWLSTAAAPEFRDLSRLVR